MNINIDPSRILQTGFGFWGSKVLLTAVELGVFTELGDKAMTGEALGKKLELHPRGIWDFFDFLEQNGGPAFDGLTVLADGGYRLSGRWKWGTGVMHSDWVMVGGLRRSRRAKSEREIGPRSRINSKMADRLTRMMRQRLKMTAIRILIFSSYKYLINE